MIVLLGSRALSFYSDRVKPSIDIDILGEYDEIVSFMKSQGEAISTYPIDGGKKLIAKYPDKIIEAEINWGHGSSKTLYDLANKDPVVWITPLSKRCIHVPSLDLLYTLKMSHRYLRNSPHFLKTMNHIHIMREMGAKIPSEYKAFLKEREKETYHYGHPKLNVTRRAFFRDDGISYLYDHDSIHIAIKHLDKPAYNYYSNAEVMCSRKLFEACSEEIRLYGVLEEMYVLALERSQIPFKDSGITPRKSFDIAAQKVASSITSGWFREFCWESYYKVMNMYDDNYVKKFWDKVAAGEVALAAKE